MRHEDIGQNLETIAFDFFYWFSRFEFALKENRYLKNTAVGAKAEPGWDKFIKKWSAQYSTSDEAKQLLQERPKSQIVGPNGDLEWKDLGPNEVDNDLEKVVRLLKTVRNNLFHGGKHSADSWDNVVRTETLLKLGKAVLDQLARLAGIEADYTRYY